MKLSTTLWITLSAVALAASAASAAPPTVVMPPIPAAKGITGPVAQGFDAHLRGALGKQAKLTGKAATEAALKAASVSDLCLSDTCGEKLAAAAKARFVLSAGVTNSDEIYEVKLSLYDQALHKRTESKQSCELCAVEEVDGTLTKALEALKPALAAAPPPATPPPAPKAEAPAKVKLTLTTAPPGAAVFIDEGEAPIGVTPFEGELLPGPRRIVLRKEGFREVERTVTVTDKPVSLALTLVVDLSPGGVDAPSGSSLAPPAVVAAAAPAAGGGHTGVGVGMAIGGAVLAGVGTFLILLDGEITCDDGRGRTECPNVYNTKGPGIAGLGVGAGLIGASVATFILDALAPAAPAAPSVAPTPEAAGAVFQVGGRF